MHRLGQTFKMASRVQESLQSSMQNLKEQLPESLSTFEITMNILLTVGIGLLTVLLVMYYVVSRKVKVPVLQNLSRHPTKPRFRKRDKVLFYGRKVLRKVHSFAKHTIHDVSTTGRSTKKKRQLVVKLARKLLQFKKEQAHPQLQHREPPPSLLEVDLPESEYEHRLPSEVMYMLRSVRVLGHFERPIFLELCKYMESRFIPTGSYLFKVGDADDSIYVVQSGKVRVFIKEPDGTEYNVKEVNSGDSIHSLLSVLDVLTGNPAPYKTVNAIALQDTTILRLPAIAFQYVLDRFPESLVRVVQIIMVRLQRVTFMALHNYLGLTYELINPENQSDKSFSVHTIGQSPKGSPHKLSRESRVASLSHEEGRRSRAASEERHSDKLARSVSEDVTSRAEKTKSVTYADDATDGETHRRNGSLSRRAESAGNLYQGRARWGSPRRRVTSYLPPSGVGLESGVRHRQASGDSPPLGRRRAASIVPPTGMGPDTDFPYTRRRAMSLTGLARKIPSSIHGYSGGTSGLVPMGSSPSDFDAACSRARVEMGTAELKNPLMTGSPPKQMSVEDISQAPDTPLRRQLSRKTTNAGEEESWGHIDNEKIIAMATQDLVTLFGLSDSSYLEGKLSLRHIPAGTNLICQGDQDAELFFVVTGTLSVLQQAVGKETDKETTLFVTHPGEVVGALAVLTGEPSFFTVRTRTDARVMVISKHDFYSIMKEEPKIVINMSKTVLRRMSSFIRQIDFALDWMQIEAGRALFRQGEHSDSLYIILNGRLRSVVTHADGKKELVGEYGRGELVGLVEVLTQQERATTVMAVRDTELAQIPEEMLNMIKRKYPQIVTRLIHLLGERILGNIRGPARVTSSLSEHPNVDPRPAVANLATVAILAVTENVPLSNFTLELQYSLNAIGATLRLTSEIIQNRLGNAAFDSVNEYRLSTWLAQQEDIHRMVLYQCDYNLTPWTQRCIRQADCIFIVARFDQEPTLGKLEKQLEHMAIRAQKELILLHHEDEEKPQGTIDWLNSRGWLTTHHHIRCPKRVFSKKPQSQILELYKKLFEIEPDRLSDCSRLARFLTGTAVGLVLGGGGARGMAHVGMIRAMTEFGIPIDIVGGTSIGAFIGALWCEETNITRFTQRAREWSMGMTHIWKKLLDLTYPVTAMFSGKSFNESIREVFLESQIEDLWVPYFCITTDITASKMRVHTTGSVWRYVRSSMSLSGYLPPLCDPIDGHLLLDGGYVNNLPADVMKTQGAQNVFAVDVGSQDERDLTNYGDDLSGWWLLWKRWNPWAESIKVPNMAEIQSRLAYVSCVQQLEQVKNNDSCEYIRPPIDKFQTLQFGAFDEIHDVGFHHGKALLSGWVKSNLIKDLFVEQEQQGFTQHKSKIPREANFTDLAELISRIDEPRSRWDQEEEDLQFLLNSDDEYEDVDDYEEELDEHLSVISEPAEMLGECVEQRARARSEGGSPNRHSPTEDLELEEEITEARRRRSSMVDAAALRDKLPMERLAEH